MDPSTEFRAVNPKGIYIAVDAQPQDQAISSENEQMTDDDRASVGARSVRSVKSVRSTVRSTVPLTEMKKKKEESSAESESSDEKPKAKKKPKKKKKQTVVTKQNGVLILRWVSTFWLFGFGLFNLIGLGLSGVVDTNGSVVVVSVFSTLIFVIHIFYLISTFSPTAWDKPTKQLWAARWFIACMVTSISIFLAVILVAFQDKMKDRPINETQTGLYAANFCVLFITLIINYRAHEMRLYDLAVAQVNSKKKPASAV
jgi:hypothetical protein